MTKSRLISLFLIFIITAKNVLAQDKSIEIGGKIINELTFYNGYAPGIGGQIIYRMGKHSGIESGLYYKIRPISFNFYPPIITTFYYVEASERNILFPVLYRFDSRFVNFTIGPVLEYFIGWKQNRSNSDVVIKDYVTDRLELISTASISKNFMISHKWIFEPEIRFSAFVPNGDGGYGLNFSFRKILR
jgi:hypothetical protein